MNQAVNEVADVAPRVLVLEDDAAISDVTCSFLSRCGYCCTAAFSGTEAQLLMRDEIPFDLLICDLMVPGVSGEEVVLFVRSKSDIPIIVASAKSTVPDKVALLRMGADDYLVKPFDLDELLARVEANVRRAQKTPKAGQQEQGALPAFAPSKQDAEILTYADWCASLTNRSFTANGLPLRLTRTEFDIVCLLMRHPRKVFTKRELFELVWHEEAAIEEKAVNTHISNIRTKLKEVGAHGSIETVWGIGFKLADASEEAAR